MSNKLDNIEVRLTALEDYMTAMKMRSDCLEEGLKGWMGKTNLTLLPSRGGC